MHRLEPGDGAVLRMRQEAQLEQLADGSWRAHYAGVEWSVTGVTREAAVARLQAEDQRRVETDPEYRNELFRLAQRAEVDPAPGVTGERISRAEYWMHTGGRERVTVERETPPPAS